MKHLEDNLDTALKKFKHPEYNLHSSLRERIEITNNLCWLWKGATAGSRKYPVLKKNKHRIHVLKFLFNYFGIPHPAGLLKQKCLNSNCVNPWHSWSSRDSIRCFRGHIRTTLNTHITKNDTKICKVCVSQEGARNNVS